MALKHSTLDEVKNKKHPKRQLNDIERRLRARERNNVAAENSDEIAPQGASLLGTLNSPKVTRPGVFVINTTTETQIMSQEILEPGMINEKTVVHLTVTGRFANNTGVNRNATFRLYQNGPGPSDLVISPAAAVTVSTSASERTFKYEAFIGYDPETDFRTVEEIIIIDNVLQSRSSHQTSQQQPGSVISLGIAVWLTVELSTALVDLNLLSDKAIFQVLQGDAVQNEDYKYFLQGSSDVTTSWTIFDTFIQSNTATTNYGTNALLNCGENNAAVSTNRVLIKPDINGIPSSMIISSVKLAFIITADLSSNARDFKLFRLMRDWVYNQATWNIWKTANNWTTAGASGDGTDVDLTTDGAWATLNFTATEAVGSIKTFDINTTLFEKFRNGTYPYYGFLMKADTETNDLYQFNSSKATSPWLRPYFVVEGILP
jgi:hypothetical protein